MSIGELFQIKKRLWQDQVETFKRYHRKSVRFCLIDLSFGLIALFINPYRTCRKFLQKKGESQVDAYGETPFTTLEKIAKLAKLTSEDCWLELGAGRGKGCFWLGCFVGCQCLGVEWVPQFVWMANGLKALFRMRQISFERKEMQEADFTRATVIYLYGTCLEEKRIEALFEKMKHVKVGTKVITISYPLEAEGFLLEQTVEVEYPWGKAEAFFQVRISTEEGSKIGR